MQQGWGDPEVEGIDLTHLADVVRFVAGVIEESHAVDARAVREHVVVV